MPSSAFLAAKVAPKVSEQVKHCVRQCRSYPAQNQPRLVYDLIQTCSMFPDLVPTVDNLRIPPPHATLHRLVAVRGHIKVPRSQSQPRDSYYVPLTVWLMPYHPGGPPLIYVTPPKSLHIRPHHPHVNAESGMVYLPYLSQWHSLHSRVHIAVQNVIAAFAQGESPLCDKATLDELLHPHERRSLLSTLSRRAHDSLSRRHLVAVRDTDDAHRKLRNIQSLWCDVIGSDKVPPDVCDQVRDTRKQIARLRHLHNDLLQWVSFHPPTPAEASVDLVQPRTHAQSQTFECLACERAISDAMDHCDDAITAGILSPEQYVRQVRLLATKQFLNRALMKKLGLSWTEDQFLYS